MNNQEKPPTDTKKPKEWHPQQSKLLQNWAEIASSYRWMHNQAYMIYKKKNLRFMIPLIVMSTVTGTANFAQSTFPVSIRDYVPQIIGAINLISAIMTTIYQFLKISEFMESHRISSINYGKLARTITVELNLPVKDRNSGGAECVKVSRTEIDRLIEQSPAIPKSVLANYAQQFAGRGLSEPEIVVINKVDIYEDRENVVANTLAEAGAKLKGLVKKKPLFTTMASSSPTEKRKENLNNELNSIQNSRLVSRINTNVLSNIISRFSPKKEKPALPLQFKEVTNEIDEIDNKSILPEPEIPQPVNEEPEHTIINIETPESQEIEQTVNETVNQLVQDTVKAVGGIPDELEEVKGKVSVKERMTKFT